MTTTVAGSTEEHTYEIDRAGPTRDGMPQPLAAQGDEPYVLAALLDDMPEAALLVRAVPETLRLVHEPSRLALLARLRSGRFAAVVFPVLDARGLPTAPLIQQCVEHAGTDVVAMCCSPPARASALLAAARAGARVIVAPSVPELSALLTDVARTAPPRPLVTRGSLAAIEPGFLRDVLAGATQTVGENGGVGTFAALLNVSTRTLSRQLRRAELPSPRALLAAAHLLLACAESESLRETATSARQSDGATVRRLVRTARQFSVPVGAGGVQDQPTLPRFSDALGAVVRTLGGHLAT